MARGQRHRGSDKNPGRLMGVSIDITTNKLAEQVLKERLAFEALLAEISMRFVNLPVHRIDHEIEDTERRSSSEHAISGSAVAQSSTARRWSVWRTDPRNRTTGPSLIRKSVLPVVNAPRAVLWKPSQRMRTARQR